MGCGLPEAPRDIRLSLLLLRVGEYLRRLAPFNELAQVEEGGPVGDARGLLHVVRDDDDGVLVCTRNPLLLASQGLQD